jgi:hypothetical protein
MYLYRLQIKWGYRTNTKWAKHHRHVRQVNSPNVWAVIHHNMILSTRIFFLKNGQYENLSSKINYLCDFSNVLTVTKQHSGWQML